MKLEHHHCRPRPAPAVVPELCVGRAKLTMQRVELKIEKKDLPVIALTALGGFLLVVIALATRDLGTAIFVGLVAGVPSGAGGGALVCILRRYFERK